MSLSLQTRRALRCSTGLSLASIPYTACLTSSTLMLYMHHRRMQVQGVEQCVQQQTYSITYIGMYTPDCTACIYCIVQPGAPWPHMQVHLMVWYCSTLATGHRDLSCLTVRPCECSELPTLCLVGSDTAGTLHWVCLSLFCTPLCAVPCAISKLPCLHGPLCEPCARDCSHVHAKPYQLTVQCLCQQALWLPMPSFSQHCHSHRSTFLAVSFQ